MHFLIHIIQQSMRSLIAGATAQTDCPHSARRQARTLGLTLIAAMLIASPAFAQGSKGEAFTSTSSDDHIWFVVPSAETPGTFELRHIGWAEGAEDMPTTFTSHATLPRTPIAIGAFGERIHVVLPPDPEGESDARTVYTATINYRESLNAWFTTPLDRMALAPSLPGEGHLAAFAGHRVGPIALILPRSTRSRADGQDPQQVSPRLLQLIGVEWVDLELPEGFVARGESFLDTAGPRGEQIVLLTGADDRSSTSVVWTRSKDGEWQSATLDISSSDVLWTTRVDRQLALVHRTGEKGVLGVSFLRPTLLQRRMQIDQPEFGWTILGGARGLTMIAHTQSGSGPMHIAVASVDGGSFGEPADLTRHRPDMIQMYISALVMACMIFGIVMLFVLRPNPQLPMERPEGFVVARLGPRLLATLIDLAPGWGVAVILTGADAIDILRVPMFVTELFTTMPYLIMACTCLLHECITEAIFGRSIGKMIVGLRVIEVEGSRPGLRRVVLRLFGKFMTLMVPVVAVFVVLNPLRQGFGDILARTLVGDWSSGDGQQVEGQDPPADADGR